MKHTEIEVVNTVAHWKGRSPLNNDLNFTVFITQSYNITSEEYTV